ncbi:uncharacterized protein METZ01_LOCUS417393, partial [marine metagenome]
VAFNEYDRQVRLNSLTQFFPKESPYSHAEILMYFAYLIDTVCC